ncbi:MAG: hypothetical protein ACRDU8_02330 [Egibacteraceae bacterium]
MARADLHDALVLDREIFQASQVDASVLDPVVRVEGALPGTARPITVLRVYQGPQGGQYEHFVLTDSSGRELARSRVRRLQLSGEMFEDRFVDTLHDVRIERGDEHTMTFFVNDVAVGSIPVFIESGLGGDPAVAARETFGKALSKGAVLWVTVGQPYEAAAVTSRAHTRRRSRKPAPKQAHTQPVWYVWTDGKVYVLDGATEQQVPGLAEAEEVSLTARSKDLRSQVSNVRAAVRQIPPDDERFEAVGRMALGRRLNLPDGDGALDRWKANCVFVELTPDFGRERAEATVAAAADSGSPAPDDGASASTPGRVADAENIHVEAQVDQEVYDQLIAEGKSERIARAKAKAAYVRREKARIREERAGSQSPPGNGDPSEREGASA